MNSESGDIWSFPSQQSSGGVIEWEFVDGLPQRIRLGDFVADVFDPRLRLSNYAIAQDGRAFPCEFAFHPETGERLNKATSNIRRSGSPSFLPSGQSVLPFDKRLNVSDRTRVTNIPAGAVALFSTGVPVHHFCITANGDLHFSAGFDQWFFIEKLSHPQQTLSSFGVVVFAKGFATVLSNHAVIYQFVEGSPLPTKEIRHGDGRTFCGPPSSLENGIIVFPVQNDQDILLALYDPVKSLWIEEMRVDGPQLDITQCFPPPIHNGSTQPDIFWVADNGYLVLTTELGERRVRSYLFPSGQNAVSAAPALRDEQDTIYVLTQTTENYCYTSLSPNCRTVELSGPHLAAGRGRYIGRSFYPSLWSDESVSLQIEAGTRKLLLPLAYSTNIKGATDSALLVLVNDVDDVESLFSKASDRCFTGSLYLHSGAQLHALQITLRFRSRFEIMMLLEDDALIVGSALTNDFYRLEQ
jgi:hypothetical protein